MDITLINSDCLEHVSLAVPDNSIDTIITDPPYGLEFMGKGWDKGVPGVEFWKAFLSATKPGGTLLVFGGTRTYHRMTCAIEDAGWEIRDCMMWLYGSGFPKSHNLKGQFKGWGTALKPAWEPIIVAMKPLNGTFAENAEKWGVAGMNIDGGRIGTTEKLGRPFNEANNQVMGKFQRFGNPNEPGGRWPANLILDEEAGKLLDEQSGTLKSGGSLHERSLANAECFGEFSPGRNSSRPPDSGGASRFFYCAKASKSERNAGLEGMPEKQSSDFRKGGAGNTRSEENYSKMSNFHPTVKPLKLMEYLCTLTKTPTGGVVMDPYMGSGTTGLAAKNTGRDFIGIEKDSEYFKIAEARITGAQPEGVNGPK